MRNPDCRLLCPYIIAAEPRPISLGYLSNMPNEGSLPSAPSTFEEAIYERRLEQSKGCPGPGEEVVVVEIGWFWNRSAGLQIRPVCRRGLNPVANPTAMEPAKIGV